MPPAPLRTSFVGCGRVGLTLGRLFAHRKSIEIRQVITRSRESAEAACAFMGSGHPARDPGELEPVDLLCVFTSDAEIPAAVGDLQAAPGWVDSTTVIHASGASSSTVLHPLREIGAHVASIHPIRSFAEATQRDDVLDGVVCGAEGDAEALARATPLFEAAGARLVAIEPDAKRLYHAAAVLACNHLVGLIESSLEVYAAAGVDRAIALDALAPLVRGTVENVLTRGPERSLSGPIVRGEAEVVEGQLEDLAHVSTRVQTIYRTLAQQTLPLARGVEGTIAARLDAVERVLEDEDEPTG